MCVFTCIASYLTVGELHHVCVYLYSQLAHHRRAPPCVFTCIASQLTIGERHHVCIYLYCQLTYNRRAPSCVFTCITSQLTIGELHSLAIFVLLYEMLQFTANIFKLLCCCDGQLITKYIFLRRLTTVICVRLTSLYYMSVFYLWLLID